MPSPPPDVATDGALCGWRVWSQIPLPELMPWSGPDQPAEIVIRIGEPPAVEGRRIDHAEAAIVINESEARLDVYGVALFTVRHGSEVVVAPQPSAAPHEVRNFLLGTVLGILCHQRGLYPLHAACLRLGAGACAFSGNSGAGKSTLAAALAARGHALLSDDLCILDLRGPRPLVLPAFPRVKLWPRSLDALAVQAPETLDDGEKHHFRFAPVDSFLAAPIPLEAIYFLRPADESLPAGIHTVPALDAIRLLQQQVFRHFLAREMGLAGRLFSATGLIASTVPVRLLSRPMDFAHLPATLQLLEDAHAGVGPENQAQQARRAKTT